MQRLLNEWILLNVSHQTTKTIRSEVKFDLDQQKVRGTTVSSSG